MNKIVQQKAKSFKAEITVVFKTCDLMDLDELNNKYNGNIVIAVNDLINCYSLSDILEDQGEIINIKKID